MVVRGIRFHSLVVILFSGFLPLHMHASSVTAGQGDDNGTTGRRIETGVPFLLMSPDARSGAMGDASVATSPDANSIHANPAKLAFITDSTGVSLSYSPWLHHLVNDMYMAYLSAYYKVSSRNTIGLSLRYFSAGDIEFRDGQNQVNGTFNPNQFAIDGTFSRKFGENFSIGTAIRFIYSDLSGVQVAQGQQSHAGTALAADVSAYYRREATLLSKEGYVAFGINISNIGNRINYAGQGEKLFLPSNLRIGTSATIEIDALSELTVAADLNKLLVPTPPQLDSAGNIIAGRDPDRSVPSAVFGSFSDAPGGLSEELKEISCSIGAEYIYNKQFIGRAGYFYENPEKGDRRYLTLGAGFLYSNFKFDFSYLFASQEKSPLANTLRFTLTYKIK